MFSIPRQVAAILAPLMDRGVLLVEGTVVGDRNTYEIPISLQLFSSRGNMEEMEYRLRTFDLFPTMVVRGGARFQARPPPPAPAPRQYVPPVIPGRQIPPVIPGRQNPPVAPPRSSQGYVAPTPPAPPLPNPARDYNTLVRSSIAFDPRSIRSVQEKFGMSIDDLQNLPTAKQPAKVSTKMIGYQLQGLAWMLDKEHPKLPEADQVRQFWTKQGQHWVNVATF
jgi:SWI/SNF-related matrix-associated actin-dependent regulator of chromatin subfamily A3